MLEYRTMVIWKYVCSNQNSFLLHWSKVHITNFGQSAIQCREDRSQVNRSIILFSCKQQSSRRHNYMSICTHSDIIHLADTLAKRPYVCSSHSMYRTWCAVNMVSKTNAPFGEKTKMIIYGNKFQQLSECCSKYSTLKKKLA